MRIKSSSKKKGNAYVRNDNSALRKIVRELKAFLKATVPDATETRNAWGVPTFEVIHPFCIYMVGKNHVTLGFHSGALLSDPLGLLQGTGKNMRHVKLRTLEDLKHPGLKQLIAVAAKFEGTPMRGMSGKRKSL
jgi:hypothetical protein